MSIITERNKRAMKQEQIAVDERSLLTILHYVNHALPVPMQPVKDAFGQLCRDLLAAGYNHQQITATLSDGALHQDGQP